MIYSQIPQERANLRVYQADAKRDVFSAWDSCDSVMLQMPTGTGKTFLFTSIINDLLRYYKAQHIELNILVVAHRMELLDQISDALNVYGIPHGFIQGNREQHLWQRIQVGSIMSLLTSRNELNVQRLDFDYIIVDEAHHSLAETYKKLFETFPKAKKLGVTATPWRMNHETFTSLYHDILLTPQVSWFINEGYLSDFDYVSIKPDSEIQRLVNASEVASTGDFEAHDLENTFDNQRIRAKLFESYIKFAKGKKGIIYCINKRHAASVAATYNANGVKAVAIDCDTPKSDRENLIEKFKTGNIQVLVNVEIFTEGFDCPDVEFIQLARPTRSLALYLQQVGRGLRITKGKAKSIILDNVGLYNYFGLPDANRKWRYHFIGKETPDEVSYEKPEKEGYEAYPIEGEQLNFDEENEEMMVVRGSVTSNEEYIEIKVNRKEEDPIVEFSLCDYYLVRGNKNKFSVYPFVKKRGKTTEAVSSCIYEYDKDKMPMEFGHGIVKNINILAQSPKAQTVVMFAASLYGKNLMEVMKVKEPGTTLFEILQGFDKFKN